MDTNIVDLVSTPPPPSPTQITQEDNPYIPTISPVDICKNVMPESLKERFDQDGDFQAYIEELPELLTSIQKITTKCPLIEANASRKILSQKIGQIPQKPRSVGIIKSTFLRNPDKTS